MNRIYLIIAILCLIVGTSCSNKRITEPSQLHELPTVLNAPSIALSYKGANYYISLDSWNKISDELKDKVTLKGIRIPCDEGDFILDRSDVYLRYGSVMLGEFIDNRDDFEDLPTKKEAECIVAHWDQIQDMLWKTYMSVMIGAYWTKELVDDEFKRAMSVHSFYIFGENHCNGEGEGYISTAQSLNRLHLRTVKRLN